MARRLEPLLLGLAVLAAGLASIATGQDANWDLLNYHRYNPWAWLNGRYGFDVAPAQLQTFHNPLADVPFHLMVVADWPPRAIAFAMAIPAGIAVYLVYRIARLAFAGPAARAPAVAIAAAVIVGATGPNARSLLGSTMNEWHVAALVLLALFLLAREVQAESLRTPMLVVAGLLAGAASGLKLTAAGNALAMAVALFATRGLRQGARDAIVFGVATLAGLAITLGPWMAQLYALTGNPLFPYFNPVFQSPLLPADWTLAKPFGPRTLAQWLTLPFDLLRPPQGYISEQRYRDARFPLVAGLALLALLLRGVRGRVGVASAPFDDAPGTRAMLRFGAVFFAVAFALWAWLHAIHRYLLTLEVLTGVALVALVALLVPARHRVWTIVAVAALVIVTTRAPNWWRVPYGDAYVSVDVPAVAPGSLVIVHGGPLAFLLPAFPADARFVGIANNLVGERDSGVRRHVHAVLAAHPGPLAVLHLRGDDPSRALAGYGLAVSGACREVRSNLARRPAALCAVARS